MNTYTKSTAVIGGILLTAAIAVVVYIRSATAAAPSSQPVAATTAPAFIGVDELMRNVKKHSGVVIVEGIVSGRSESEQKLALIDTKEFEACNSVECAELVLPVRWSGSMPSLKQKIRATGEVKEDDNGKFAFVASTVQAVLQTEGQK